MRTHLTLASLLILLCTACNPSISNILADTTSGQAVIQHENGSFSKAMDTKTAFATLRSNEKLYLSTGKVQLFEPIELIGLQNVQVIGKNTRLVAKIDMPVVTFKNAFNIKLRDLYIVHEIGDICSQNCVEFYNSAELDIQNCSFDGSGYFGLALSTVQNALIENNTFFNCEYGIAAWGCESLIVKGNAFGRNRSEDIMVNERKQFSNDIEGENTYTKE